jgi:hypothetical protein
MHRILSVLALAALASCQHIERPTYREPDPKPVERPLPPPERILRVPPDFRFSEPESGKTYFYRGYAETLPGGGEFKHEVVTVIGPGDKIEREATAEERAHALEVLETDWRNKGMDEQIRYHLEMMRIGRERRDSLVDAKIVFAEQAVKALDERVVELEADLVASTRTAGYQPPAGRVEFLQREIAEAQSNRAETRAKLEMLRYLQSSRERAFGRSSRIPSGS